MFNLKWGSTDRNRQYSFHENLADKPNVRGMVVFLKGEGEIERAYRRARIYHLNSTGRDLKTP